MKRELSVKKTHWLYFGLFILAFFLQFAFLNAKPPHADEGVNGWFADQISEVGYFKYDPTNFHGPLPIYLIYFFKILFGKNLVALRATGALFGLMTVWLTTRFERFWGLAPTFTAAVLVALSPAMMFFSRGTIHEPMLLFFMVLAIYGYFAKSPWIFFLAWAGGVVTKETWTVTFLSFGLAALISKEVNLKKVNYQEFIKKSWQPFLISLLALALFFTGFGKNPQGFIDFFKGFVPWFNTASGHGQEKPFYYWLQLFFRYEPAAFLGLFYATWVVFKKSGGQKLLALFALIQFLIYTVIPYKTPWCILQILWPLFFMAGFAFEKFGQRKTVLGVLLSFSLFMTARLNFFHFADEAEPYVYIQTYEEFGDLMDFIVNEAKKNPQVYQAGVIVAMGNPWPLPWILGDFKNAGYYQEVPLNKNLLNSAGLLIVDADKSLTLDLALKGDFFKRQLKMRPYMNEVVVYFSKKMFHNEPR